MRQEEIPLTEAAARLRLSYNQTLRFVLLGRLCGEQRDGRWRVTVRSVEKLLREREAQDAPAV